jgi:hypothetical protein
MVLFLYGCEKNPYFQSESNVARKISKQWTLVRISKYMPMENWSFYNGKVYRISTSTIPNDTVDVGTYSVKTTISEAYIYLNLPKLPEFNGEITIYTLTDDVLVLTGTDANTGRGMVSREFIAKK